ncbi:MAG TPA: ABC transporter substrate-binding protein [Burkholderiales bacterium]
MAVIALGPCAALAQPAKVYRVGFLGTASASGYQREVEWIRDGLRRFGYEEGKNVAIEYRWADGSAERLRQIAGEFVAANVDAILVHNIPGALAASRATSTIPIVMADGADPVAAGLAASLARPGGNITGSTSFVPEESVKRLELLKQLAPAVRRIAFLSTASPPPAFTVTRKALERSAASMGVAIHDFPVRDPAALPEAFRAMGAAAMDGVLVNNEPVLNAQANVIAALASLARLPSAGYPTFADAGGLIAYGASRPALYGRAGYFLDRIFKGARAGELPFEQAAKFDLILNQKTARALGMAIPSTLRLRADRIIE